MHIPIIMAHACNLLGLNLRFLIVGAITPLIEVCRHCLLVDDLSPLFWLIV
jgi:hypothetical protein